MSPRFRDLTSLVLIVIGFVLLAVGIVALALAGAWPLAAVLGGAVLLGFGASVGMYDPLAVGEGETRDRVGA